MKLSLTMPQFGESITEAQIVRWLKKEGEEVREQEPLIEMETEKAVFSYESPFQGRLVKILFGENQQVAVGTDIAHFEIPEGVGQKYLSMGIGKAMGGPAAAPREEKSPPLSPLIRSLAKERGVTIAEVERLKGTGPDGRLTKEDFLKYAEARRPSGGGEREGVKEIPLTPIRARIAENMSLSKREIPHAGTGLDVDITRIEEWRKKPGSKIGLLSFVFFSVVPALRKFPVLNGSLKEKGGRRLIEEYASIHLGIATATPQGLMVPVVKNADRLSFSQMAQELGRLIEKARAGRLEVSELTGGTFTINNTGALGAVRSTQIIPPAQSGILAVNRSSRRPVVVGEAVQVRSILPLDLAFDHRIVDGDAACGFLEEVRHRLEEFDFSAAGIS